MAWQQRSALWGRPLPDAVESVDCPLCFPGQFHDAEIGLHYNVFRYYDPATARYLSPDPLGLDAGPDRPVPRDASSVEQKQAHNWANTAITPGFKTSTNPIQLKPLVTAFSTIEHPVFTPYSRARPPARARPAHSSTWTGPDMCHRRHRDQLPGPMQSVSGSQVSVPAIRGLGGALLGLEVNVDQAEPLMESLSASNRLSS